MNNEAEYERDLARLMRADPYALRHLIEHLHRAGQHDTLITLLTKNKAWMDAKFTRLGVGDSAIVSDLDLALSNFPDPLKSTDTVPLVSLYMVSQVVNRRVSSLTNFDLVELVNKGRIEEAIGTAKLRAKANDACEGLLVIDKRLRNQGIYLFAVILIWESSSKSALPNS